MKMEIIDKGKDNKVINKIGENVRIKIDGNNNEIILSKKINNIDFLVQGNNNFISIKENVAIFRNLKVTITGNNSKLVINKNTTIFKGYILINEDENKVVIGEDCMISDDVKILASDSHAIISTNTGECINAHKRGIEIGNHVWLGMNALVLKDARIGDNSIIAAGSVVTYKKGEKNIIIAGNPSKKIKEGVTWERKAPSKNEISKEEKLDEEVAEGKIKFYIEDKILMKKSLKQISGWAYLENFDSLQSEIYFEIENRLSKKIYKAQMYKREDIAKISKNNNYINSGFTIIFPNNIKFDKIKNINIIIKNTNKIYKNKVLL